MVLLLLGRERLSIVLYCIFYAPCAIGSKVRARPASTVQLFGHGCILWGHNPSCPCSAKLVEEVLSEVRLCPLLRVPSTRPTAPATAVLRTARRSSACPGT